MDKRETPELHAAREKVAQKQNELAKANTELEIAEHAGNPALFIPIADLEQYGTSLTSSDRKLLSGIVTQLQSKRFFLGELIFDDLSKPAKNDLGLGKNQLGVVRRLLGSYDIENIKNYNLRSEVAQLQKKQQTNNPGTGQYDAMRKHLRDMFDSVIFSRDLELGSVSGPDAAGQLTATFNVSSSLQEQIAEAELTNEEIAEAVDYSLNRAIVRAQLQRVKSKEKTDEAMTFYRGDGPVRAKQTKDNVIQIDIPLSAEIKGAFRNVKRPLNTEVLQETFQHEMNMGVRLALLKKQKSRTVTLG